MIGTLSGKLLDPFKLSPADIDIEEVAHSLAQQNRYTGHTKFPLSVAQHSTLLSRNVPRHLAFAALLHDGPEYLVSDIAWPIKSRLEGYQEIEDIVTGVFVLKFGLTFSDLEAVKEYDRRICVDEINQLCAFPPPKGLKPLRIGKIREMDWRDARDEFLDRFYELYDGEDDLGGGPTDASAFMSVDSFMGALA